MRAEAVEVNLRNCLQDMASIEARLDQAQPYRLMQNAPHPFTASMASRIYLCGVVSVLRGRKIKP